MNEKMKLRSKLGFSLGTLAKDFISPIWGSYLLYFYTDVFGLAAGAAATLLFVARIWDAVNDPMMGVIADKTKTKLGRYRPYILLTPIPLYIFATLTFTTPDLASTGKLIWAYITYIGTGMLFTAYDVPYWGMLTTLTKDEGDRNQMISWLRIVSTTGYMLMNYLTLPLVSILGNGNDQAGFRNLLIVTCIISYIFALICFFTTKEKYNNEKNSASLKDMVKALATNRPLMVLMVIMALLYIYMQMPVTIGAYYIIYKLGRYDLVGLLLTLPTFAAYVGIFAAPYLVKKMSGIKACAISFLVFALLGVLGYFAVGTSVALYIIIVCLQGITNGIPQVVLSTFIADTSDYSEWKNGVRCDGTAFSLQSFAVKLGQAMASAVGGVVLGMTGYIANSATQTDTVLNAMTLARYLAPAVVAVVCAAALKFYPITRELKAEMTLALEEKRKQQV